MTETGAVGASERITRLLHGPLDVARGVASALPRATEDLFRDRCPQYAASIAYRVLFSLFPLTIVLVSIFGLILQDDELRQDVIDELVAFLPVSEEGEADVERSIEGIASPLSAIGLISLVALLWGASGMMAAIRIGLEAALKVDRGRPAAHAKLVDFVLVGVLGMLVIIVVGLSIVGASVGRVIGRVTDSAGGLDTTSFVVLREGVQLVAIGVTALLLYRFVPARRLRRTAALAGAIVTAVGIWGASKLLAIVFDNFSGLNLVYGSLAGVMAFLFFVYVVGLILLFGAEFAYAWSQPPEPPGPPARVKFAGFLRGLFVHHDEDEGGAPPRSP